MTETFEFRFFERVLSFSGRYLSYLASIGAVSEIDQDHYAANNVTRNLAEKVSEAGISHW